LKTSKITRRKLKIPRFQNTKIKKIQSSQEERQKAPPPLAKFHTKVFEDPQNDKKN
jgi:hypothetical protein